MKTLVTFGWLFLLCCSWLFGQAQSSVLASGDWYKLSVEKAGVYRISFDLLKKMGIDPTKINPRNIKIYGRTGGMLPQDTSIPRPLGLVECAIKVEGEADGNFGKGDYILFYADGPDLSQYDAAREIVQYQNNIYSDENYYFLTVGSDAGKRLSVSENIEGVFPVINSFNDVAFHELDQTNIERSGREWYGEKFGLIPSHTLKFALAGITEGSSVKVVSDVMGQTFNEASFKLFVNNAAIAEQKIFPIPNGRYSVKGLHKRDTIVLNASDIAASSRAEQEVRYDFIKGAGSSQGYLNFILLSVVRDLALYHDQTIFLSAASLLNEASTFHIAHVTAGAQVWDVTDHYNAQLQDFQINGTTGSFSAETVELRKWIVFDANTPEPKFVSRVANQDLAGKTTPQLLIITHNDFRAEAERLAAHRAAFNNWSAVVATVDEIYNEFSGGRQDVSALRDFAKHLRDKNPSALKSILLFGKSSYDYKDRIVNNTNFVPTYQSRNSLHPLQTYSSDDFFAFLEDGEGEWQESPAQHHSLDVGVGRLPVKTAAEAANIVNKIIAYDTNKKTLGAWRKKIVFVADDGNSEDDFTSLHQYQADQLANNIEQNFPAFDTRRLFMGSYKKHVQPNGETVGDLEDDIRRSFDQGALIINFTGHGSELVWTDERVLTEKTI
ncbi:MAG TPA: type IX secretion system sortase PorU, partial [Chryseosolibacter sp.]|nr:type IX secretion system sortase PorU [Chryseosolibacter sp.]